jgi:hypothetical protein
LESSEGSWTRGFVAMGAADAEGIRMPMGGRLMVRRVLAITVIAVALSAAGALAFAPSFSRVSHAWSRGTAWSGRAFTPVPVPRDSSAASHDASLENEAVPGTYCPIRPHDPSMSVASPLDQRMSTEPAMSSSVSTPPLGKTDLLTAPAMCNVAPPVTTHATPAQPPILP